MLFPFPNLTVGRQISTTDFVGAKCVSKALLPSPIIHSLVVVLGFASMDKLKKLLNGHA